MYRKATALLIGSLLISIGINNFFLPFNILDGGIFGLALILYYQWGFHVGLTIILLSIPIYIYAWYYYRGYFYNSIAGLIVSALFIDSLSINSFGFLSNQPLLSALIGGCILGIGVGVMFQVDISTGGLDLFAQMVSERTQINIGIMILIVDLLAIAPGFWVLSINEIILSMIAILSTGFTTTLVTLNLDEQELNFHYSS